MGAVLVQCVQRLLVGGAEPVVVGEVAEQLAVLDERAVLGVGGDAVLELVDDLDRLTALVGPSA